MRKDWFRSLKSNWGALAMGTALVVSLALNIYQGWQLRIASAAGVFTSANPTGEYLAPVDARSISGEAVSLDFKSPSGSIVYYLSPTCPWCERNYPNIVELAKHTAQRYRFIALAKETDRPKLADHLKQYPVPFEIYLVDPTWLRDNALRGTPATLVVSSEGKVEQFWAGAYGRAVFPEVEKFFRVKLPGLSPPKTTS